MAASNENWSDWEATVDDGLDDDEFKREGYPLFRN